MSKADITLTKSIIFDDIENFLNDIIELKYVNIEIGMGLDKYYPNKNIQPEFLDRIDNLKVLLIKNGVPLTNIRMHVPVGYRYDVYDTLYDYSLEHDGSSPEHLKITYGSFDALEMFISKAYAAGFRHFVVHPPNFCIETTFIKKNPQTGESYADVNRMDFDKLVDEYCIRLGALQKKVGSGFLKNMTEKFYGIYMEFTDSRGSFYDGEGIKKIYMGISMPIYKEILRRTHVHALLDTGVFESINEYKIAKLKLEREGFKIRAIHLQQSQYYAHHSALTEEQFKQVVEDFSGIIVDEGLFNHEFKEGELHAAMQSGEDKQYYLTKEEHLNITKNYLKILGPRAKLVFKLNKVLDKRFEVIKNW